MNFLVETKNEYTIQLINILTPHLYEGFESIYNESKKIIKKGEEKKVLKAFQQFIKKIPSWNTNLIENETIRIKNASRCDFLNNLLKAVIKANIILLSNNNPNCNNTQIDQEFLDIPLPKFIHKCYIECARQFYNSPYLFYHDMKPIDRKRNQRDANDFIKQSIKEAIRKILPVQHILNQYLGSKILIGPDQVDKPISNADSDNLKNLLSQDLNTGFKTIKSDSPFKSNVEESIKLVEPDIKLDSINLTRVSYKDNSEENETSKLISEMKRNMNENTLLIDINSESPNNQSDHRSIPITQYYSENKHSIKEELKESERKHTNEQLRESERKHINEQLRESERKHTNEVVNSEYQKTEDNQIKNIVISKNKENESESSIAYIGKDDEYEDVFSNILESNSFDNNSINKNTINNRDDKKRKDIYFSRFNGL